MDPFTLPPDELSALSVEQALRRRLDVRNRRVLPALQGFLVPFFFGALISAFVDFKGNGWPLAAAGLVVTIGSLMALRRLLPLAGPGEAPPPLRAPALAERFGELLQGLLVLEYLLGVGWIASIGGRPALIFVAAPALLMFRLVASELVLLHALCVVAGGVVWWATHADDALSAIVGATLVHSPRAASACC